MVLFEGILAFYDKKIRDLFNMKCFVDTDPDTRLERRGRNEHFAVLYVHTVEVVHCRFARCFGYHLMLNIGVCCSQMHNDCACVNGVVSRKHYLN